MTIENLLGFKIVQVTAQKAVVEVNGGEQLSGPYVDNIDAFLAETAAMLGAETAVRKEQAAVKINTQISHLKTGTNQHLLAIAEPISLGQTIQVWQVKIREGVKNEVVSIATVTLANQPKQ
jgi:uncharacterized protein (TIGR00369 family)